MLVVVRGGGDLASGVAVRLYKAGFSVIVTELEKPLAVRRAVSFAEAIYAGTLEVEGIRAQSAQHWQEAVTMLPDRIIPVLVDPLALILNELPVQILVDGRMTKRPPELQYPADWFTVGLGPGFNAGENCDAAVETKRGHYLGRVYWHGSPEADTGIPEAVGSRQNERVLRSPVDGFFRTAVNIGDEIAPDALLATVAEHEIRASFGGIVRGILHDGLQVQKGMKVGDIDPRLDSRLCYLVSDKALAVGGGVLEAILSIPHLRKGICQPG
jgi:xanthine dehydrogenase accessory factor